ncbi:MAG: malate synthase A [Thermoflexus sp.]|uniref:malate synthase A n=1 Tax=Thermoflexus sp. TaxID=1969742 RepID=UPI00331D9D02
MLPKGVEIVGRKNTGFEEVLAPEAVAFVAELAREFEEERQRLLEHRRQRRARIAAGERPTFPPETEGIRRSEWRVAPPPPDLQTRWVEITGPTDRKMIINALNSGAQVFMADFEDANVPTWSNLIEGQQNLREAVRRTIRYTAPDGRIYRLGERIATLVVRPRGIHLDEPRLRVDGRPVAGALFDLGLFLYHNAHALLEQGSGPYLYLPKLEGYREARWWNQVCQAAEDRLGLPRGAVRVSVLIEHILAAFEMEEILYELRERATALNLGRWDYIFSMIKVFAHDPTMVLPDRSRLTVSGTPFLRAAARRLVQVAHRRGAHAIGGMSAYIPRRDPEVNARAFAEVEADKAWEVALGFDGAWVAHPGLVPLVEGIFRRNLEGPHQWHRIPDGEVTAEDLLERPEGPITEEGLRQNVAVALQYLGAWLAGRGAVAIFHRMEDTATAEIARSQIWQWRRHGARLADGRPIDAATYCRIREAELEALRAAPPEPGARYEDAAALLDALVLSEALVEFLTIPGMAMLHEGGEP